MHYILQLLFWMAVLALVHSYYIYPMHLRFRARRAAGGDLHMPGKANLGGDGTPHLFIIMAVYNEEKVLAQKLDSIYNTTYPSGKFDVLVGSDNSTDGTNRILERYAGKHGNLHWKLYGGRMGKIGIINNLMEDYAGKIGAGAGSVAVLTDANVFFTPDMLGLLARAFGKPEVGVVAANVLNIGVKDAGISFQEQWYIQRENNIKYHEGLVWGTMMGAFGACYALRAGLFVPVPENFIVDDFFLTMKALEAGHDAIKEPKAVCYEDVPDDIFEEFRRKRRISAGNFQNLRTFAHLLHPRHGALAYCFWSHKVLRWLGPFFMVLAVATSGVLATQNHFYAVLFYLQLLGLPLACLDFALKHFDVHIKPLRFFSYFMLMNLALLLGFFHYLKGIDNNVWKPTKRQ